MYNMEKFDPSQFGDSKIIRQSEISSTQFNPRTPNFLINSVKQEELEDDIELI